MIRAHKDRIYAIAITGDGTGISASGDGTLKLWNLETGAEVRTLIGHRAAVASVAIFDNGRKAISGAADIRI